MRGPRTHFLNTLPWPCLQTTRDSLGQSLGRAALYLSASARPLRFTQNKSDKAMLSAGLAWVTATLLSHVLGFR